MAEKDVKISIHAEVQQFQSSMRDGAAAMDDFANRGRTMANSVISVSKLMGAALVGMGAAAIAMASKALAAADKMNDLAQATGVGVETLSRLQLSAKTSRLSLEQLAGNLGRLSKNMSDAADGSGVSARAFAALGISVKDSTGHLKGADQVMIDLASKFSKMEDGAGKTALAMQIFGRGGQEMIPILNGGAEGMREMAEMADHLGLTMDTKTAQAAGRVSDTLDVMKSAMGGLTNKVMAAMLPTFEALASQLLATAKDTGALQIAADLLSGSLKTLVSVAIIVKNAFDIMGDVVRTTARAKFLLAMGDFKGAINIIKDGAREIRGDYTEAINGVNKIWNGMGSAALDTAIKVEKLRAPLMASGGAAKKTKDEFQSLLNTLETRGDSVSKKFYDDLELLNKGYVAGRISLERYVKAVEELIKRTPFAKNLANEHDEALKFQAEGVKRLAKEEENYIKELEKGVADKQKELAALTLKNDLLEKGVVAIEDLQAAEAAAALDAAWKLENVTYEEIEALEKKLGLQQQIADEARRGTRIKAVKDEAKELAEAYNKTSDDINRSLTDALMRGFESGKGFAKNFRDTLKNLFNTLILRPIISAIVKPVGQWAAGLASGGMSAAANAAGMGGGMGGLGNLATMGGIVDYGMTALGIGSTAAATGTYASIIGGSAAAGGQAALLAAQTAEFGMAGMAATAEAGAFAAGGSTMAGGITTGLASIPVWGWVAIAAIALYSMFSKEGGGPKLGGSFMANFMGKGLAGSQDGVTRLYTPNQADDRIKPLVDSVNGVYQDLISRLGSKRTDVTFGLGFDSDPQGTAPNRVSASVSASGQNLLNILNRGLGREEKDLEPGLKQAMAEMLQAALVPAFKDIGKAFGDLMKGFTGNLEEVTSYALALITLNEALVKGGAAFDKLKESLGGFGQMSLQMATDLAHIVSYAVADPIKAATDIAQQQSRGLLDNWNAQGDAVRELLKSYDGSISATQQLAAATQARYQTELELVKQINVALVSVSSLFRGSAESIRFGVLDTAGKDQFLADKITNLETLLLSASDPAVIQTISQDLNSAVMARFNLIDPTQQARRAEEFAGYLEYLDSQAQARLNSTLSGVSAEHDPNNPQSLATLINNALTDAAAKLAAAALAQQTAANTQLQAANTPLNVNVDVNVDVENNSANTEVAIA